MSGTLISEVLLLVSRDALATNILVLYLWSQGPQFFFDATISSPYVNFIL